MAKSKLVLVLERSGENLNVNKDEKGIVLEGVFAQFGVVNNNDRIYEEGEYLPHLKYLQEKIGKNRLLGELDHPERFEVSLTNASHMIEKLEFDKEKRQILGRIRILDTPKGKIAKELIESGVPISISSRAAGLVESNKKVKIKKIFTYDMVMDPGFDEAVLNRVNESLGLKSDGLLQVFEGEKMADYSDYASLIEENVETQEVKSKPSEMQQNFVSTEELDAYSKVVKEEIEALQAKMTSLSEKADSEFATKLNSLNETLTALTEKITNVETTVAKTVEHNNHIVGRLNKAIGFTNYLAKTVDESIRYTETVGAKTDKAIQYAEHLKEEIDHGIKFANYLKECIEEGVSYAEYVGSKADKAIQFGEHIQEKVNEIYKENDGINEKVVQVIGFGNYLSKTLDEGIAYTETIAEQAQELSDFVDFAVNEKKTNTIASTPAADNSTPVDYTTLPGQVAQMIESTKKEKVEKEQKLIESRLAIEKYGYLNGTKFFGMLSEAKQAEFLKLEETKKQKVLKALNESGSHTETEIVKVWEESLASKEELWLTDAPAEYKKIWESLDLKQKGLIEAQAKFYKLDTLPRIKNFWETRQLQKVVNLNESKKEDVSKSSTPYTPSYLDNVKAGLDRLNGRR